MTSEEQSADGRRPGRPWRPTLYPLLGRRGRSSSALRPGPRATAGGVPDGAGVARDSRLVGTAEILAATPERASARREPGPRYAGAYMQLLAQVAAHRVAT